MAITFPLDSVEWFGALPIQTMRLDLVEQVVGDMTGRGEWLTDAVAPALWQGEVTLARMSEAERAHAAVMMDLILDGGMFWAYDIRRPAPLADPRGVFLGGAVPALQAVGPGRSIALNGLPARYVLSRGDYIRFARDGGRYALHRVAEARVVAGDDGVTPSFTLSHPVPAGTLAGTVVSLVRPAIPCIRIPGSMSAGSTRATITEGFTFRFTQTMAVIA